MTAVIFIVLTMAGNYGRAWIVPEQVASVREVKTGEYAKDCHTLVTTLSNNFCVVEQPLDVVRKLENSK